MYGSIRGSRIHIACIVASLVVLAYRGVDRILSRPMGWDVAAISNPRPIHPTLLPGCVVARSQKGSGMPRS
jgi:hypothetical protein